MTEMKKKRKLTDIERIDILWDKIKSLGFNGEVSITRSDMDINIYVKERNIIRSSIPYICKVCKTLRLDEKMETD